MNNYLAEDKDKVSWDGLIGSILIHLLLLLAFWWLTMNVIKPPEEEQGILINFGTSDEGIGEVQPITEAETTPKEQEEQAQPQPKTEESSKPDKKTPKPVVEKKVKTVKDKKAPALPVKKKKKKTEKKKTESKPKKETVQPKKETTKNKTETEKKTETKKTETKPAPKKEESKEPVKKVDENSLFKGNKGNTSTSQGNKGDKEADMGSKMGKVEISDNIGKISPGLGNGGVGYSLKGRKLVSIPPINDKSPKVGKINIEITVDRNGKVTKAVYTSAGSTTNDSYLRGLALSAAKKAKFSAEPNGPEYQKGSITFTFRVK